jgi:hypothetical protein
MTGSLSRIQDRWGRVRLLLSVVAVMALAMTSIVVSAGSAGAYPRTSYFVGNCTGFNEGCVEGHFIWYNQSVQVGGTLYAPGDAALGNAVVYTAYSGSGTMIARAARPGDGVYLYGGKLGHGFTLDPNVVAGGIETIDVTIWFRNRSTGQTYKCCTVAFRRP